VNESMITGESRPVRKEVGAPVIRRDCNRRRNRRRRGSGRCRPRAKRSEGCATHYRPQQSDLPEDDSEPVVGGRVQHLRDPVGGRRAGALGHRSSCRDGRSSDVAEHDRRRGECSVVASRRTLTGEFLA